MPLFWIITGLLTAAAIAFVLVPLLRSRDTTSTVDRDTLNVELIRQQLKELRDDLETGELETAEYEKARTDLEKELLYELQGEDGRRPAGPSGRGRWVAPVILVTVPALAFVLYWQLGAYPVASRLQAGQVATASEGATAGQGLPSIEEMAARLAQRLQQDPTNSEGWRMLGKTYSVLKRYPEAAAALEKANALTDGKDPEILADYAEALALAQGGGIAGRPAELLAAALTLDPDSIKALWLTGYQAYQAHDIPRAVATWQRLAALFPPDSAEATRIQQVIAEAQGKTRPEAAGAGRQQAASTPQGTGQQPAAAAAGKSLSLHVTLDEGLQDKVNPDDTVFVFARAAQGPRMPLAIVRKQVRDLPLDVVLDDSMAMSPAMSLSRFPQVSVEARVSRSGNAMTESGDLRGAVDSATPGQSGTVQVTIDTVVP